MALTDKFVDNDLELITKAALLALEGRQFRARFCTTHAIDPGRVYRARKKMERVINEQERIPIKS